MKNLKKISIFLSLVFFTPTNGMQTLKEKISILYENNIAYRSGVLIIDTIAIITSHIVWLAYIMNKQKIDIQLHDKPIASRISKIEKNIRQKEKNVIKALYQDFNISDDAQHIINSAINQYKQYEKEYIACAHQENKTNAMFGPHLLLPFKECDINPAAITTIISSIPHKDGDEIYASAESLEASVTINNGHLVIEKYINPPRIILYPSFFRLSDLDKDCGLVHELSHVIEQHSATKASLVGLLSTYTGINVEEIRSNTHFKELITIHERQAEILHKNAEYAAIMRKHRSQFYYPEHLFLGHYAQLVQIDAIYQLKKKCTFYKPILIQKIADLKTMKFSL